MKLSIITINYNNAEGLRKTLASVASQTYRDIEHIIVDGASTDGSVDVIKEYENQLNITHSTIHLFWSSEKDNGIYDAMNRGIRKATGEYVQILNSGDLLAAPDVTERMMAALNELMNEGVNELREVPIFYGNMLKSYDGKTIINRDTCGGKMYTPESFLYFYKGTLNHDCAYIRRDLFEKYGLYNEDMKICSDWEWYVRAIVLGGEKPIYTNIDVTIFDMNGVSESHGKNAELIKKERREYLESILPPAVLRDYDQFAFPLLQYQRLKKYHLWGLVHFIERVLFKFEKWGIFSK
jgi:glycosyltransferase involved in cell wall biosynthesis